MTTRATVYMTEDAAIVIDDEKADILAIRQNGQIEVWSYNGETHMGNMPDYADGYTIRLVVVYWQRGFFDGARFGRDEAQDKLRAALGLETTPHA